MGHLQELLERDGSEPVDILPPPLKALWWLKKGGLAMGPEWHAAHAICQQREGDRAYDLVHALAHWIEGDEANARYWYRRAGEGRSPTIATEWERISAALISSEATDTT